MHGDTDVYLALARSLAEGGGYRVAGAFCRAQPPGFPFVLGLVSSRSRVHYVPENLFVVLAALGASLASYWLLSQRYGGRRLLVLALLVAVNPQFVLMANAILSEMPFLLSSALFLAAATRFWRVRARRWLWGRVS